MNISRNLRTGTVLPLLFVAALCLLRIPAADAQTPAESPHDTLSLQQAIQLAGQGPAVEQAEAAIDRASAEKRQAKSYLRPKLALSGGARYLASDPGFLIPAGDLGNPVPLPLVGGERFVWTSSLSVDQVIWDGGRSRRALISTGHAEDAAKAARDAARRAVDLQTTTVYAQARVASRLVETAKKEVERYEELLRQISALVREEQIPFSDQHQARAALEAARLQLIQVRSMKRNSMAALEELTGVKVNQLSPLPPPHSGAADEEDLISRAIDHREEIRALRHQIKALEARADALRADTHPMLIAHAEASHLDDSYQLHKDNFSAALALRIPILDGGLSKALAASVDAEVRASRANLEELHRTIIRQVEEASNASVSAQQSLVAARAADHAAQEAVRLARLRYEEQLISNRELLDAEAAANTAHHQLLNAETQLRATDLSLRLITGDALFNSEEKTDEG